jgi:DNA-binding MarR family transcriptional regulator
MPAKAATTTKTPAKVGLKIRDLLSFRIHLVANSMSRSAATSYKQAYDVTLGEWRTIALLGGYAPMSLNEVARSAGLDKGQSSRIVSDLVNKGLVLRNPSPAGGKTVDLSLTAKGKKMYKGLMKIASERNDAFIACLTDDERVAFESGLNKLTAVSRALNKEAARG